MRPNNPKIITDDSPTNMDTSVIRPPFHPSKWPFGFHAMSHPPISTAGASSINVGTYLVDGQHQLIIAITGPKIALENCHRLGEKRHLVETVSPLQTTKGKGEKFRNEMQ